MQIRLSNPWIIAAAFLLTLIMLGTLTGCGVQKHTITTTENRDSVVLMLTQKALAEVIKDRDHYRKKVEELEYLAITFAECPPAVNTDSLLKYGCDTGYVAGLRSKLDSAQSSFERLADGTVKVQGRIASITLSKQRIEDSLHERNAEVIRLKSELAVAKSQVKTEIKTVEKEVKRGWAWWKWFVIGLISGIVLLAILLKWALNGSEDENL